jgi:MoxR-like ATPase
MRSNLMIPENDIEAVAALSAVRHKIKGEIAKIIVGQDAVIDLMLTALLCRGHALLVGVPGLAKTTLVKALSSALHLSFNRIQFTPDLMPSDITGTDILEENTLTHKREFAFIRGPIFANLLLADEINRTPPKTQAALLQAMQEGFVTAGGRHHEITPPFLVFATQNPIEQEGTYPLPEAQLDRFMFHISVDYPGLEEEVGIVMRGTSAQQNVVTPVMGPEDLIAYQKLTDRVPVPEGVARYAVKLARASRPKDCKADKFIQEKVRWGAGPRAAQFLVAGAKARAILRGVPAAETEDVKALALPILRHRIVPSFHAEAEGITAESIVAHLLNSVEYE